MRIREIARELVFFPGLIRPDDIAFDVRLQGLEHAGFALADQVQRRVYRDTVNPGIEPGRALELVPLVPGV